MPLSALALLIVAALLHAGWNLVLKRAGERLVVTWWALVVGAALAAPLLLVRAPLPAEVWPYVLVSAAAEAAYFALLAHAYDQGDFSLVYPVARGAAPLLLALWAVLFLGESPSAGGVAGLLVLALGLAVVGGSGLLVRAAPRAASRVSVALALGVALLISVYSAIDGAAVRRADPLTYTVVVFALSALVELPLVLWRPGWRAVASAWRARWPTIALIGTLTLASYALVLSAYAVAPVSYGGAIRELSIVFGALAGWLWLGERFGALRVAGAAVMVTGIALIALLG
jgi:drug/metabolite transporter (DMT)-like permease